MIKVLGKIPDKVYVACSGGVDSMVAVDFIRRGKRDVIPLFFNHGDEESDKAEALIRKLFGDTAKYGKITRPRKKGEGQEEYWRNERYNFFSNFTDRQVITCHHLDDQVETWIFGAVRGKPKLIPYINGNTLRPFILNEKSEFYAWAARNNVEFLEDAVNLDTTFARNQIRHKVLPELYKVNPGLKTVVRKKVLEMYNTGSVYIQLGHEGSINF